MPAATHPNPNERSLRAHQAITLGLLFAAGVINFFDRVSLSVANTLVRGELHLNATDMGLLLSIFSMAYGLSQLPLVGVLDRIGTRVALGAGLTVWSVAQLLTGLVRGFPMFAALRVLLGMGESPFYPSGVRAVREWFPESTRGRATAVMSSSQTFSLALAPPMLTLLMIAVGWRAMFMVLGGVGLVVALFWIVLQRPRSATVYREAVTHAGSGWSAIPELLSQRAAWGMMVGFGGVNYTVWLYTAWLPGYLQTERHLSLARSGWLAAIPFLAGAAGMLTSGVSADWWRKRGARLTTLHRVQIVAAMLLSAGSSFAVSRSSTTSAAVAGISLALFFIHFGGTSGWAYVQAVSPARLVGAMGALQNFGSFVIASGAPLLTGWIVDRTHSFALGFAVCAVVTVVGAASYATLAAPAGMRLRD